MMNKNSLIYVAGHTGLVGSAIVRRLKEKGYTNLSLRTHKELDLTDRNHTETFFKKEGPMHVFLAAARVGGIFANNKYPAEFIYQNIMIQTNVIDLAYKYGTKKLLFLGSSCIYPKICPQPINEEALLTGPIEPTNEPFGVAKIAGIEMCQAYNRQYGTNFITAIPANVYGINDHFGEGGHVVAALLGRFHEAKTKGHDSVTIWGSGKPRREFLYVDDLADACIFLMNTYNESEPINIGRGSDTSIAELAEMIKKTVGFEGTIIYDRLRPDGIPRRLLDSSRITKLGWMPTIGLEEGLRRTYEWYKENFQPS
jgi:GDP-L-fucose synthase